MTLPGIGLLASNSNRTRLYLQQLARNDLQPVCVLYLDPPAHPTPEGRAAQRQAGQFDHLDFDLDFSIPDWLEKHNWACQRLPTGDPNDPAVCAAVAACPATVLIYSGPSGLLLRQPLLDVGRRFLHVHSGYLPDYRGSTTLYYQLLDQGDCAASALFLEAQIDQGPVVLRRRFPPPADRTSIDLFYDAYIRSQVLIDVLQIYRLTGVLPAELQPTEVGRTFFVIHPVLKHLAILASGAPV